MNQIYFKTKYLFVLLSFFVCSAGIAQSPFQNVKQNGTKQALDAPETTTDPTSKKKDSNAILTGNAVNFSSQEEENIKGVKLSEKESE